ncbi:hypothetical protein LCGC14_1805800, partial [marine sediment metagenome]
MMKWESVELRGYSYYSERGYRILVPLVDVSGYDFVAEKDGTFIRVNVKRAGLKSKDNPNSWSIARASGSFKVGKDVVNIDVYLA